MADATLFHQYLRQPKSAMQYGAEMDRAEADQLELQGARRKNALEAAAMQQQAETVRRNAIVDAARASAARAANGDPKAYAAALRASGQPALFAEADARDKADVEMRDKQADIGKKTGAVLDEAIKRYRGALDFIDTPEGAARWLQAQYSDPVLRPHMEQFGTLEQAVAQIPRDQRFSQWRQQNALGMDRFMEQQRLQAGQAREDRNALIGPDGKPNQAVVASKKDIARAGASSVSVNTGQKGLDNTLKLRGDFRSEPVYKAHQEMQSAYAQIKQSLGQASPAGDLAGATKIMKLLDPGSVVRESELGMAMAASGLLDRVQNYAQNILSGTKLTPAQRADFLRLADALYGESVNQYNAKRGEYEGIAKRNELPVADVVGSASTMPAASAPGGGGREVNFSDLK